MLVLRDLQDNLARLGHKDYLEIEVLLGSLEVLDLLVQLGLQDQLAHQVMQAHKDHKGLKARLDS